MQARGLLFPAGAGFCCLLLSLPAGSFSCRSCCQDGSGASVGEEQKRWARRQAELLQKRSRRRSCVLKMAWGKAGERLRSWQKAGERGGLLGGAE